MFEFKCNKCTRIKKPELLAYTYKSKQGERKVCTHCAQRIKDAGKMT